MKIKIFFYPFILLTALTLSCTKPETKTDPVQVHERAAEPAQSVQPAFRYEGIGLRLHTMVEWTDDAHTLWRRVYSGCYDDIIIEARDKTNFNESGHYQIILFNDAQDTYIRVGDKTIFNEVDLYQYILFDYVKKEVTDIITIGNSSSPLLFYKSRLPNTLLLENYDGTQRYKYVYGEGVSAVEDAEFMSLFNGKYFSESPYNDAYLVRYTRHSVESPPVVYYKIDESRLPEAWPEGLNAEYSLLDKLNARLFNSPPHITRATDWKVWDNKYVFMLSSDKNSNPYGHRAYYVVRTLDNKLVFTIPQIMAPALKYESDPLYLLHDTLIDFSADQKRVLIKGMYNDKLCIMIYDIVTYEEWTEMGNTSSAHLTLGSDLTSPLETSKNIDAEQYSVEPGTTTMYGVFGNIWGDPVLYEKPDENSNIIMLLNNETMDKYKHGDTWLMDDMLCFEILNCKETKTIANYTQDYWFQIRFDSAVNWEPPGDRRYSTYYHYITAGPDVYSEYTGWVLGDIRLLDRINNYIIIQSRPLE